MFFGFVLALVGCVTFLYSFASILEIVYKKLLQKEITLIDLLKIFTGFVISSMIIAHWPLEPIEDGPLSLLVTFGISFGIIGVVNLYTERFSSVKKTIDKLNK